MVTLNIVTGLLIFAGVAAVGALLLVLVHRLMGDGALLSVLGDLVIACASRVALIYLWRHRRP